VELRLGSYDLLLSRPNCYGSEPLLRNPRISPLKRPVHKIMLIVADNLYYAVRRVKGSC
jgi:hypothetical protein